MPAGKHAHLVALHIAQLAPSLADFKDCLSAVYSAIDEADFLAIDGEFSGNYGHI